MEEQEKRKSRPVKINVNSVSLIYELRDRTLHVLNNINLNIYNQEFLCLIGPSGCGKTSLLKIIAGLIQPSSGSVTMDGKLVEGSSRDRAVVFQTDAVFPWMSVEENVGYGPKVSGKTGIEVKEIVKRFLRFTDLEDFAKAWPKELSGGMRKRVDLARAFANNPEVLLMDEPFGSLDVMTKEKIQIELQKLYKINPRTVFFVTHDLEEALFLGYRVIVMSPCPGKIVAEVEVPFPIPRDPIIKTDPEFVKMRRNLMSLLYEPS